MAYQQKLLYISGLMIVGLAILAGMRQFQSSSVAANQDALTLDLLGVVGKVQEYYRTPECLDGGGSSFAGLTADEKSMKKLFISSENENGFFEIVNSSDKGDFVTVRATGQQDSDGDGQKLTVEVKVYPTSYETKIISR